MSWNKLDLAANIKFWCAFQMIYFILYGFILKYLKELFYLIRCWKYRSSAKFQTLDMDMEPL